jgi:thiamine biosynthesis lipoprotein
MNKKAAFIGLIITLIIFSACKKQPQAYKVSGNALGTTYHISYKGDKIDSLNEKVDSIVFAVNHGLSTYQKNSLITAFNTNDNSMWQNPEDAKHFMNDMQHFVEMVSLSKKITTRTEGAFDPSAALLFDIYNESKKQGVVMDSMEVMEAMSHQGMSKILFDPNGFPIKQDSLLQLNFNAIAKGYLVDIIAGYLASNGVNDYMVEVGGELVVSGRNFADEQWEVGISVPLIEADPGQLFETYHLDSGAMATSGNYRNFYEVDGEVIGHTLDPRSGKPAMNSLKSVSVFHLDCAVADAYATAFMVMGLEDSKKLIENDESLSAYFIYEIDSELKGEFVD